MNKFYYETHNLDYFRREYDIDHNTLLYKRLVDTGLNNYDICEMLWIFVNTCHWCYNGDGSCQCMNDD